MAWMIADDEDLRHEPAVNLVAGRAIATEDEDEGRQALGGPRESRAPAHRSRIYLGLSGPVSQSTQRNGPSTLGG